MTPEAFIASRLRFKGRLAECAVALSFLVIILAIAVSGGFRKEIKRAVSDISGDITLSSGAALSDSEPVSMDDEWVKSVKDLPGVRSVSAVVARPGIVRKGDVIHGVIFKGVASTDTIPLQVRIPSRLAEILSVNVGDQIPAFFVEDKVKARKFTVSEVFFDAVQPDDRMTVYASLSDMQRLCGMEEDEVSSFEIRLEERLTSPNALKEMTATIGYLSPMVARSSRDNYSNLYDWLSLLDGNVLAILALMILVAGFNMVSGLLIMLFRSIPTIGTLKAVGMTDSGIAKIFLRIASRVVLKGMLAGGVIAALICVVQSATHVLKLNPVNYFVSFVPISVDIPFLLCASSVAYLVIMMLMLLPCLFISRVDPAVCVRSN